MVCGIGLLTKVEHLLSTYFRFVILVGFRYIQNNIREKN